MFRKSKLKLTKKQWERVSDIAGNIGILSFVAIGFSFWLDITNFMKAFWMLVITFILWYISFEAARRS